LDDDFKSTAPSGHVNAAKPKIDRRGKIFVSPIENKTIPHPVTGGKPDQTRFNRILRFQEKDITNEHKDFLN